MQFFDLNCGPSPRTPIPLYHQPPPPPHFSAVSPLPSLLPPPFHDPSPASHSHLCPDSPLPVPFVFWFVQICRLLRLGRGYDATACDATCWLDPQDHSGLNHTSSPTLLCIPWGVAFHGVCHSKGGGVPFHRVWLVTIWRGWFQHLDDAYSIQTGKFSQCQTGRGRACGACRSWPEEAPPARAFKLQKQNESQTLLD